MKKHIWEYIKNVELVCFGCIIFGIIILLIFGGGQEYKCKLMVDYSNSELLILGLGLGIILSLILTKCKDRLLPKMDVLENKFKYVLIIYFLILMYISYNVIFQPGWDAGVVVEASRKMVDGELDAYNNYYSLHPNNLLITCIYAFVFKVNCAYGIFNGENEIMALVSFLCLIQTITAYVVFKVMQDIIPSSYAVWITWGVYLVFMGAVPWILVPYTDSPVVIIPIAIFALYLQQKKEKRIRNWIWIGCLMFAGYYIKPQTVIIGIAIILIEAIKSLNRNKTENLIFLKKISVCIIAFGICGNVHQNFIIPNTGFELNKELELGAEHMFMMGQNAEQNGVYSQDDVMFSMSIATKKERKEANKEKAKERILTMLEENTFVNHIQKKALVNFNDGTFAWGKEGEFIKTEYSNRNQLISPFLKKVIYPSGEYRHYISTIKQMMWLVILFSGMGIVLLLKSNFPKKEEIVIISLAVIGMFLFVMLFEARARYLYTYIPFLVILASIGYCKIRELTIKIYTSIKESKNNG